METYRTKVLLSGNNTGIPVPPEIVERLGGGKKPKVAITVNGFAYRSSIAVMGGKYLISLSAERRAAAKLAGGDMVDVTLELDTAPREVDVPSDFAAALAAEPTAKSFFEGLAYSHQLRHVLAITDAKTDETRHRRVAKAIETLKAGNK